MKRILVTSLLLLFIAQVSNAQVAMDKAQANFIYNFTKFFDWPQAEKTGDFIIGVVGSRGIAGELEKVTAGKKNVTQNIVIKYFKNGDEVSKCQVVYVESFKAGALTNIHEKTGVHCLIISNSLSAIKKGAVIQFITEEDRLKYAFSKQNALNHGLKFHSKISEMASKNY